MEQFIQQALAERKAQSLYRSRKTSAGAQSPELLLDGQRVLAFCSNDYLGLASDKRIAQAMHEGIDRYGVGSGAAHLISGHSSAHHALEEELAEFTGRERALLFSTGYMANMGVISALLGRGDTLVQDRLNHASLIDGGILSRAKLKRYAHNDVVEAQGLMATAKGRCLLATDAVFSMDGDIAPLAELSSSCRAENATLMVDDAHGFGVVGETGAGCLQASGLTQEDAPILMATLGKALGTAGAFVAGSADLIEFLIQQARPYVYTTAMPPAVAEATRASLKIVQAEPWRRQHLQELIGYFRQGAERLGLDLMPSSTAIQPILLGDVDETNRWSEALLAKGIMLTAIRPPTVPQDSARLRVTLSAAHTIDHVDTLLTELAELAQ